MYQSSGTAVMCNGLLNLVSDLHRQIKRMVTCLSLVAQSVICWLVLMLDKDIIFLELSFSSFDSVS